MNVQDLISDRIPELSCDDGVTNALNLMDEYRILHLPVVENGIYIGLVSEEGLELIESPDKGLVHHNSELLDIKVNPEQHIFDAVKLFSQFDLTVLPVVGENNKYLGCITLEEMVDNIAKIQAVNEPGGIIVLEMNSNDYSMQQIGGIVESNDSKILSSSVTSYPDSTKVEITLKVNTESIAAIIQTFERYDYTIKASYQEADLNEDLKDRFDEFMNYLNI